MERARMVMVMHHEQTSPAAHARLVKIARAFARKVKLGPPMARDGCSLAPAADFSAADFLFWVRVAEEDHARLDALVASFGPGAHVRVTQQATPDADDYRKARYLTLWGEGLEDEVFPNADEAFVETTPCRCGGIDSEQVADILVRSKKVAGWEVLNAPGGGIIVSRRIATMIAERGFTGIARRPVRDAKTKQPIAMVQLLAERTALAPCPRHDESGARFCPRCGRGIEGNTIGITRITPRTAGGADLLSRYPHPHAYLYASRRLYDALEAMRAKGLGTPTDLFDVCVHPEPKKRAL